jgi:hypothetical protein
MPSDNQINLLLERIGRFQKKLSIRAGDGFSYVADVDGKQTKYTVQNLKDLREYEDELTSSFVWVWSLKDYFIKLADSKGLKSDYIYSRIKKNLSIKICADLANKFKHSSLNKPWTNLDPCLEGPGFSAPQEAIKEIQYLYAGELILNISDPQKVDIIAKINDKNGTCIGDAFNILSDGVQFWEKLLDELDSGH